MFRVYKRRSKGVAMNRLPNDVLVVVFSYLSDYADLFRCSAVCKKWKNLLDSNGYVWKQAVSNGVPRAFTNDPLVQELLESPKAQLVAYLNAWSENDHSNTIKIKCNKLTLHRNPIAQSTDAIRGKRGFSHGLHYWVVIWHGPNFGSNATVGIATKKAPLHGEGYYSLLGKDSHSWGWDISSNKLQHGGEITEKYPKPSGIKVQLKQKIGVTLDMTNRTLAFDINGKYLGEAFMNLPSGPLYPAVSAVYGNSEVSLVYLGQPLVG